jgi:hypothetical protein
MLLGVKDRVTTSECLTKFDRFLGVMVFNCAQRNRTKLQQGCRTKKEIYDLEVFAIYSNGKELHIGISTDGTDKSNKLELN